MKELFEEFGACFLAGNISGWMSVTVGQPLDYMKTHIQTSNYVHDFREMYENMGMRGFYKGASSIYMFVGIVGALEFYAFETISHLMSQVSGKKDLYELTTGQRILSGLFTGFLASFIYGPTEYSKIHSQLGKHPHVQGSAARMFYLIKDEKVKGIRKLFTGLPITIIKESPGSAIYYGGYHSLMQMTNSNRQNTSVWRQLILGGVSGVLYQLYSYPIDTIKTNVQSGQKSYREMVQSRFWEGKPFRVGFKLSLLRSFMVDATNFTVYQNIYRVLHKSIEQTM